MTASPETEKRARLGHWAGARLFDERAAGWLLPVLRPRLRVLGLLLGLGLLAALAALVPPYLTKLVIDEGLMAGDRQALVVWSLALLVVGFASLGLGSLNAILHMRASVGMLADLRAALTAAVLERSPEWRAQRRTGEILARIDGDAGEVQQFAFNALLTGSSGVLRLIGGAVMLFVLNWQLALVAVALAPFELAFFAWARPRTERLARETRAERGEFAGQIAEMVAGLGSIQAARAEEPVAQGLARRQRSLNAVLMRAQLWGEVTRGVPTGLAALVRSAIFLVGGLMVIDGQWPLGSLIAFIAYLGFLVGPMQSLIGLWHAQARVKAALDRLSGIMAEDAALAWPLAPVALPDGPGALRVEGVTLEAGGKVMARGVTLEIPGGSKMRLEGPSGAGKSTFLALFQRHGDPGAGRILLDGVDLRHLSRADLRGAVAYVPQRPFVMLGTVAENLALSAPDTPPEAMQAALALVGLSDRLAERGGLAARLGEDGLTLSGGERQRLCVARALLRPFRVLILDEALSEVDPGTVSRIMEGIDTRHKGATRIVVTHGNEAAYGGFDMTVDLRDWSAA
ncbi:ABC transporter ATP-binding protein [Maliponia aquimaris]|uniref:Putative multidrug export ATP-binding/permease protein n=1 Tax=Maliponia aquimaris TaxID=1673631 RepID=A0A238K7H0_9RHOB|nr:ABC transporter ATP-binding protein [Maliponia aquimaris]SMX38755.1 Putative multidrug export ATP-binding/permease protein [Maliponia aquimaris]